MTAIPLLLVFFVVAVHLFSKSRIRNSDREFAERLLGSRVERTSSAEEVELPEIVKTFADRSGAAFDQAIRGVRYRQLAELKMAPNKPWRQIQAEQFVNTSKSEFFWRAIRQVGPITLICIVDAYVGGKGFLHARLFGSIPVARFDGAEASHSELMRYLAELPWCPDAILKNCSLRWVELADDEVEASADSFGRVASVRFRFNDDGDIVEVVADKRGAVESGKTVMRPWRGVFSDYQMLGDRRVPAKAEVGYVYEDGYHPYFRCEVLHYEVVVD